MAEELDVQDKAGLRDLALYWQGSYRVWHDGDTYCAVRRGDPAHVITADTLGGLRMMLSDDYVAWLGEIRREAVNAAWFDSMLGEGSMSL